MQSIAHWLNTRLELFSEASVAIDGSKFKSHISAQSGDFPFLP